MLRKVLIMAAGAVLLGCHHTAQAQCEVDQIQPLSRGGSAMDAQDELLIWGHVGFSTVEGYIAIRRRVGEQWIPEEILHSGAINCLNLFGARLDLSDDVLVISDHFECSLPAGGVVYVYRRDGDQWPLEAQLTAPDEQSEGFGTSIALHGDTVVVGASGEDVNGVISAGSVYVFQKVNGKWTFESKLTDSTPDEIALFGTGLTLYGDRLLVGAPGDQGTGTVFAYRRVDGQWALEQELSGFGLANQRFGWSIALDGDGDTAVIGAPEDLGQLGSAYVFRLVDGQWDFETKLTAENPVGNFASFGDEVVVSNDSETIVVGAPVDSEGGFVAGAAHLFHFQQNHWVETAKLIGSDTTSNFGRQIALIGDQALIRGQAPAPGVNADFHNIYVFAGIEPVDCNNNGEPDGCDIANGTSFDSNDNGIPDECEGVPDFNGDEIVNVDDLLFLLKAWGSDEADTNQDGVTDVTDLLALLGAWGPLNPPVTCPADAQGACCNPHGTAGCNDSTCCDAVCATDPYCCETSWDSICVNHAQELCDCPGPQGCGEADAGNCCAFGGNGTPGCSDPDCCELICDAADPFCCEVQWDAECAMLAQLVCNDCPPAVCNPEAPDCCEDQSPLVDPGCNDPDCCGLICEMDPFCCTVVWDGICVNEANIYCAVCGGDPPGR